MYNEILMIVQNKNTNTVPASLSSGGTQREAVTVFGGIEDAIKGHSFQASRFAQCSLRKTSSQTGSGHTALVFPAFYWETKIEMYTNAISCRQEWGLLRVCSLIITIHFMLEKRKKGFSADSHLGSVHLLSWYFTSSETVRFIRDWEPRTVTSTFTQVLSSGSVRVLLTHAMKKLVTPAESHASAVSLLKNRE